MKQLGCDIIIAIQVDMLTVAAGATMYTIQITHKIQACRGIQLTTQGALHQW
jgi:hypothetical protein